MKEGPSAAVLIPLWCAIGALCLAGLSVLSRLIRMERERHPEAWEADGRPAAPWIVPWRLPPRGDPSLPRSPFDLMRTNNLALRWVFRTPAWARGDDDALRLLRAFRLLQAAAVAGAFAWFALIFPHLR